MQRKWTSWGLIHRAMLDGMDKVEFNICSQKQLVEELESLPNPPTRLINAIDKLIRRMENVNAACLEACEEAFTLVLNERREPKPDDNPPQG